MSSSLKPKRLPCPLCDAGFRHPASYIKHLTKNHVEVDSNLDWFECPLCDGDFKKVKTLIGHLEREHDDVFEGQPRVRRETADVGIQVDGVGGNKTAGNIKDDKTENKKLTAKDVEVKNSKSKYIVEIGAEIISQTGESKDNKSKCIGETEEKVTAKAVDSKVVSKSKCIEENEGKITAKTVDSKGSKSKGSEETAGEVNSNVGEIKDSKSKCIVETEADIISQGGESKDGKSKCSVENHVPFRVEVKSIQPHNENKAKTKEDMISIKGMNTRSKAAKQETLEVSQVEAVNVEINTPEDFALVKEEYFVEDNEDDPLFSPCEEENMDTEDSTTPKENDDNETIDIKEPFGKHKCHVCNKPLTTAKSILNHFALFHKGIKPYKCYMCTTQKTNTFTSRCALKAHVNYNHNNITYKCALCPKRFARPTNLRRHLAYIHYEPEETGSRENTTCKLCSKVYSSAHGLSLHVNTVHEDIRPYECELCQRAFHHKYRLKQHVAFVHQQLSNYMCDLCGKCFGKQKQLDAHTMINHFGRKEHSCYVCDKVYNLERDMKHHLKAVHKINEEDKNN